jgi:cellulose synthase (UDP-forming)
MRAIDLLFWVAFAGALLAILTLPTSVEAQLAFAATAVVCILLCNQIGARIFVRQLCIVSCFALILKYVYWRVSSTLPPLELHADFAAAAVVLVAEIYCIVMVICSTFVMIDPLKSRATPKLPAVLPTVDVFVPSYNEDPELVAFTLSAAKRMDYDPDRLTVWLLDDGSTDQKCQSEDPDVSERALARKAEMQALCAKLGVNYLARPRNEMAKAGNLNYGLQHSSGEIVVVLDADHAPMRNFLQETIGHFSEDPRLFMVQTPHVFLNPDPIERNLQFAGYAPSENEMFYGSIQRGLDSWNASFFCGSAAALRRTALEETHGFSGVSITEDCETALELHASGWHSRYVDKPMIRGLQPETFASFIGQRSRWCRGMIQIFLLKCPLLLPGLTLQQRICYTSSALFWFFPLARVVFLVAPLLYLFFDMKIYAASVEEFLGYTVPYLAAAIIMQSFLYGKYRWAWVSEVYEYVQSVYLVRAVLSVIANPRRPTFNVTDKGVTLAQSRLSALAWPYYAIFVVLAAATVYTGYRLSVELASRTLLLVVGGWNVFNLVIAGLALGCVAERRERRANPRLDVRRQAELTFGDAMMRVVVENASQGGVRVRPTRASKAIPLPIGSVCELRLLRGNGLGLAATNVVIRNRASAGEETRYGAGFDLSDVRRFAFVGELMYAGSALESLPPEDTRKARNLLIWTAEFLVRAMHQTLRGVLFGLFRSRPRRSAALEAHAPLRAALASKPAA